MISDSRVSILNMKITRSESGKNPDEKFERMKSLQLNIYKPPVNIKESYRFDLIQSVNSNVKFGGFYNGSVNIQFSPVMYIKPFSFLSIFASRQKNLFIPMADLQENMLPLAVETSGMIVIENLVKVFAPPDKTVRGIAEFALKNCISFLMYSIFNADEKNNSGVSAYNFYYFSAGITF